MFMSSHIHPFGITVTNTACNKSILDVPHDEIENMIAEHKAVVLRGFGLLDERDFINFASRLGPLLKWEFGEILNLRIEKKPQNHLFTAARVELHWDGAYISDVPRFSLFQCLHSDSDRTGGETLFTDTTKILKDASEEDRRRWSDMRIEYRTDKAAHYSGHITVPLVGVHPFTRQKTIRYIEPYNEDNMKINPVHVRVVDMDDSEQERFLRGFTQRLYAPDYMYRHIWRRGDFLIYDNHALLHGRARIEGNVARHLQRIHILSQNG